MITTEINSFLKNNYKFLYDDEKQENTKQEFINRLQPIFNDLHIKQLENEASKMKIKQEINYKFINDILHCLIKKEKHKQLDKFLKKYKDNLYLYNHIEGFLTFTDCMYLYDDTNENKKILNNIGSGTNSGYMELEIYQCASKNKHRIPNEKTNKTLIKFSVYIEQENEEIDDNKYYFLNTGFDKDNCVELTYKLQEIADNKYNKYFTYPHDFNEPSSVIYKIFDVLCTHIYPNENVSNIMDRLVTDKFSEMMKPIKNEDKLHKKELSDDKETESDEDY